MNIFASQPKNFQDRFVVHVLGSEAIMFYNRFIAHVLGFLCPKS